MMIRRNKCPRTGEGGHKERSAQLTSETFLHQWPSPLLRRMGFQYERSMAKRKREVGPNPSGAIDDKVRIRKDEYLLA